MRARLLLHPEATFSALDVPRLDDMRVSSLAMSAQIDDQPHGFCCVDDRVMMAVLFFPRTLCTDAGMAITAVRVSQRDANEHGDSRDTRGSTARFR